MVVVDRDGREWPVGSCRGAGNQTMVDRRCESDNAGQTGVQPSAYYGMRSWYKRGDYTVGKHGLASKVRKKMPTPGEYERKEDGRASGFSSEEPPPPLSQENPQSRPESLQLERQEHEIPTPRRRRAPPGGARSLGPLPAVEVPPRGSVRKAVEVVENSRKQIILSHDEFAKWPGWHPPQAEISAGRDDFFPGARPSFVHNEFVMSETGEQWMEAARRIACVLAMHGIPGYESVRKYLETHRPDDVARWREQHSEEMPVASLDIPSRALHILATIADTDIIPLMAREAACYFGGVLPGEGDKPPHAFGPQWPKWADPSIKICNAVVADLIDAGGTSCSLLPKRSLLGYEVLKEMNGESRTGVVKAYLAAADASKRLSDHVESPVAVPWRRPYKELEGGTYNKSDEVAHYINDLVRILYDAESKLQQYTG